MGVYLNSKKPHDNYREIAESAYFVDKTAMLMELIPLVEPKGNVYEQPEKEKSNKYICITRPRRFGKTVIANMIAAFFGKGRDSSSVFRSQKIAELYPLEIVQNQYHVISITFSEIPKNCETYQQYIERIQSRLLNDLSYAFPYVKIDEGDALWDVFNTIYEYETDEKFIFVFDEWDYIFHQDFATGEDKKNYIKFLSALLKDQPYVEFAYITGILPIAKYSSGSELNMFFEYTMVSEEKFSSYFGFTDAEVDGLFARYTRKTEHPRLTRKELQLWYDGYYTLSGKRVYNPRSVVASLTNNNLGNYWTSSGPYDEIFYYIKRNIDAVRDDLALMISGISVPAQVREYAATSMNLQTKDEIFSAMVVYGFLNYEKGVVSIPNKELMEQFNRMLKKESTLGYVYRLARESERMLKATLEGDTRTMTDILEFAHNTEIPLLDYNHETELTALVNLVYLAARDYYRIEREDKAGIGYVDFIFYPELDKAADGIILELKVNHTPEEAIRQIKERKYALRFQGKTGEEKIHCKRIIAVGISYDKQTKKHDCMVEVLRNR